MRRDGAPRKLPPMCDLLSELVTICTWPGCSCAEPLGWLRAPSASCKTHRPVVGCVKSDPGTGPLSGLARCVHLALDVEWISARMRAVVRNLVAIMLRE